jgi:predicted DNA-binding protein (MmcQ/YjbR family)
MTRHTDSILRALRERGLRYPGAHLKSPWPGHLDLAVNDKTFAYLSVDGEPLKISCKLPSSSEVALLLPFCSPTPYGLGKSGWVSARFDDGAEIPVEMLEAWIDESYRAQAPKKLVKLLDASPTLLGPSSVGAPPKATKVTTKVTKAATKATKATTKATKVTTKATKVTRPSGRPVAVSKRTDQAKAKSRG